MSTSTTDPPSTATPPSKKIEPTPLNLTKIKVDSENTAFNLLISFVGIAQRRGAFGLDEAAKIFECIQMFRKNES